MIKVLIFIILLFITILIFVYSKKFGNKVKFINAIIVILMSIILIFFLLQDKNIKKKYVSPRFDGEKIIPGHFYDN